MVKSNFITKIQIQFYSPSCPSLVELLEGDTPGRCTMTVSAGISTPVDDATADELS